MIENAITLDSVVQALPGQVSCDLEGDAAILNLKAGVYYRLGQVGAVVWKLIEQPCTVGSIRDAMLKEYEVEIGVCERDLFELLARLSGEGLIEVRAGDA